ncbi:YgeY family selenium metabolism-linked hydrolase [Clostridium botulinum]|uniref:YgeY family selenium metabolism-linked hydrolase n=1 Tax=Clostridium botulinum TaxID=1491 RepID=UPI0004D6C96D|nr:YgeY family selenium metabolism-linked hydrolase [Clostridium botulinum]KEH91804.1 peptidase [Clostridium botulinum C/D str. It1]
MKLENKLNANVEKYREDIVSFLKDIINIPSVTLKEEKVAFRIKKEMDRVGCDCSFIDDFGNVIGKVGNGKNIIVIEAHIDTVNAGDRELWVQNPFVANIKDGVVYGRGTLEQKGAIASMVYAVKAIKDLNIKGEYTLYIIGSIMKEEYDGEALRYIINKDNIYPDYVILTEPTNLNIHIGSMGRAEIDIIIKGLSADSGYPKIGINSIYKASPIVNELKRLNDLYMKNLSGKALISVNEIICTTPSKSCVPDKCIIKVDSRMWNRYALGDILNDVKALKSVKNYEVKISTTNKKTYTGYGYNAKHVLLPWINEKNSYILKTTIETYKSLYNKSPKIDKWILTTNGSITAGVFNIPTIGFGPGKEILAYGPREQVLVDDLLKASVMYALLPFNLSKYK